MSGVAQWQPLSLCTDILYVHRPLTPCRVVYIATCPSLCVGVRLVYTVVIAQSLVCPSTQCMLNDARLLHMEPIMQYLLIQASYTGCDFYTTTYLLCSAVGVSLTVVCLAIIAFFVGFSVFAHFRYPHVHENKRRRKEA